MNKPSTILGYNSTQVAYPIGPSKDAYYLVSTYITDVETNRTAISHSAERNIHGERVKLKIGTPKECLEYIERIVKEQTQSQPAETSN